MKNTHHRSGTARLFTAFSLSTALGLASSLGALPQSGAGDTPGIQDAKAQLDAQVAEAERTLVELQNKINAELLPLSESLSERVAEKDELSAEFQSLVRTLDGRNLDLRGLKTEISSRADEVDFLEGFLTDYIRSFESRLHVAENAVYGERILEAVLAPESSNLTQREVFERQTELVDLSIERLESALGGERFEGTAVDSEGMVRSGTFVLVGPAAVFRSEDGTQVGTVERQVNSEVPTLLPFGNPEDALAAGELAATGAGRFPVDVTLGNAHKVESTNETFLEHAKKGGTVMIPISLMAGTALLIALWKWLSLTTQGVPRRKKIEGVLDAVARHDVPAANEAAKKMGGPVGAMLSVGVDHIEEPKELIEEAMYESLLTRRLKLNSMLPFIAICAASAPLLGLLGTVTGIINTFKMITIFGSGDVKSLSGGISEALITTKFGLIVAIPSLLLHAFLARKAKHVVSTMESTALALVNVVSRHPFARTHEGGLTLTPVSPQPVEEKAVREQVREVLTGMLEPAAGEEPSGAVAASKS